MQDQNQTKNIDLVKKERGAVATIVYTFALYFIPQVLLGILIGLVISIVGLSPDKVKSIPSELFQFFAAIVVDALIIFGLYRILKKEKKSIKELGFSRRPKINDFLNALGVFVIYAISMAVVFTLIGRLFPDFNVNQAQDIGYTKDSTNLYIVMAFFGLVIFPPFIEEILFRGFLYKGLRKEWGLAVSLVTTSLIFGMAHMQFNVAIDTFILSAGLIYLLEKTGSLWASIFLHAIKNGVAFMYLFFIK